MADSSPESDRGRKRDRRPRSDRATLLGTVIAVLALGWSIYAYYYPQPSSVAQPPPASSSASAIPSPRQTDSSRSPGGQLEGWASEVTDFAAKAWDRFGERSEHDRHSSSWWSLLVAWLLLTGLVLWMISDDLPFLLAPLSQVGYVYYFWPSLSLFGVIVTIIGGVLATAAAGIVWLER